ncbi:MAG: glycosyltransferase family 2 protein, partial [Lachnospiraceae bacterium]|nr:glycosyltransferase family 2 protein [Lachnospiraceae bacterium]
IIPTYRPEKKLFELIEKLERQTVPIGRIILMNTEEKYFDNLIYGTDFGERHKSVVVHHLSKREFDHGNTRNMGVAGSNSDLFVMMTQDAMPEGGELIEHLIRPLLEDKEVVVSYARQLPNRDCREIERFTRAFNYPEQSKVKSIRDLETMGIKTFFCSNVCAAYRRDYFMESGGFIKHTIFNEDMIYAANALKNGKKIAYAADARVIHSHNYTAMQQLRRNFDLGVSQADHPEIFAGVRSESEGIRLIGQTSRYLIKRHLPVQIPVLYVHSAFKFVGYQLGKRYKKLPERWIRHLTSNKDYWRQYQLKKDIAKIDATKGYGRNPEKEG